MQKSIKLWNFLPIQVGVFMWGIRTTEGCNVRQCKRFTLTPTEMCSLEVQVSLVQMVLPTVIDKCIDVVIASWFPSIQSIATIDPNRLSAVSHRRRVTVETGPADGAGPFSLRSDTLSTFISESKTKSLVFEHGVAYQETYYLLGDKTETTECKIGLQACAVNHI